MSRDTLPVMCKGFVSNNLYVQDPAVHADYDRLRSQLSEERVLLDLRPPVPWIIRGNNAALTIGAIAIVSLLGSLLLKLFGG